MIFNDEMRRRIEILEKRAHIHTDKTDKPTEPTLSVPVVDEDGEPVIDPKYYFGIKLTHGKRKKISFTEVCRALQDMCGIEITYQEIKGKSGVVIYEKEDD